MEDILREGLGALGVEAGSEMLMLMREYGERLLKTNAEMNLTAIREEEGVARMHFLDSAALLPMTDFAGKRVIDVGTGGGFPGIPLRILEPSLRLTAVDSVRKKVEFVDEACQALAITNVNALWGRVEEMPQLRESFDIAVSRAVAELDMLVELCLPLVRGSGLFIAMKGPDCQEEVSLAGKAIEILGGKLREVRSYTIPGTDVVHTAVIIEKVRATPMQYPRRFAQIKKKPLH